MTLDHCNKRLVERYGRHVHDDKPIFRVVFANHELEYRKGLFGPIMVFPEVRQVPKYPYAKDCFVLEKFTFIGQQPELVNITGYSYEPVWVFRDAQNHPLPLLWDAIEFLIHKLLYARPEHRTESMDKAVHEAQIEKEANENMEILDNAMRSYSSEVVNRERV